MSMQPAAGCACLSSDPSSNQPPLPAAHFPALCACGSHFPSPFPQLAVLSISDHFTRIKVSQQQSGASAVATEPRVLGMLFGRQTGRKVEIYNSKEVNIDVIDGRVVIDQESMLGDKKLCAWLVRLECTCVVAVCGFRGESRCSVCVLYALADTDVFPTHELLGWYKTGDALVHDDMDIHKQVRARGS